MTTQLTAWLSVEVLAVDSDGIRTLKLSVPHDDERLQKYEHVPLPPYIPQNDKLSDEYQTVYAKPLGSKAAPTAGLHFTKELLVKLQESHNLVEVTLHVGLGTFAPLTEQQLKSGSLHSEHYEITEKAAQVLNKARHITAIGTTSVRTLESNKKTHGFSAKFSTTDILIQPGYKWHAVDSLVTNFHLPGTSLLLLVESFVGSEPELKRIYTHAIAEKYRFYSFGDAMLIL
jgi:S-adenosylmethionine:tRNA ribosyltransferase-isomerase